MRARACVAAILPVPLLALAACSGEGEPPAPAERPNVVLIIADDQAYRDFGFMGSKVAQTPAIDRLAAEGFVFRAGYSTSSRCRPALRTLLTGLHPLQYHVREEALREQLLAAGEDPPRYPLIRRIDTLPRILGRHGYRSLQAGKHWEGPFALAGFTDGMNGGGTLRGTRFVRETTKPLDVFLARHGQSPFLLWYAPMLPHVPHDPPQRYLDLYSGLEGSLPSYYGNVTRFDRAVGELLDRIDALGARERTLVVFVVDNGWQADPDLQHLDGPHGKGTLYETGFRTPIVLRWPGRIAPGSSDALVSTVDLFPTILGYLGLSVDGDLPGRDLRPIVEGREDSVRDAVAGHMLVLRPRSPAERRDDATSGAFIREGAWRYVLYSNGAGELYDLRSDPDEQLDLATRRPDVALRLRARLTRWLRDASRPPAGAGGSDAAGSGSRRSPDVAAVQASPRSPGG